MRNFLQTVAATVIGVLIAVGIVRAYATVMDLPAIDVVQVRAGQ